MTRLEWLRTSDGRTSEADIGDMSLRVERDIESVPEYSWEVHGVAQTRGEAFEAAERAALAALRTKAVPVEEIDALIGAVHRQCAYVVVAGKPDNNVLLPLLLAARREALAVVVESNEKPLEKRAKKAKRGRPLGTYRKPGPSPRVTRRREGATQ